MNDPLGIGVIGYGYWGPNLVRNFMETPDATVVGVSDLQTDRLTPLKRRYPTVETIRDYQELLSDPRVDAIVIATPVSTHFQLAMEALNAGKHVLVEKPLSVAPREGALL